MCVYLRIKFQAFIIILTSFGHWDNFTSHPPPSSKGTPKNPTHIKVKMDASNNKAILFKRFIE